MDLSGKIPVVRDQGPVRPTCLAVATTAIHEAARGDGMQRCIEYLYAKAFDATPRTIRSQGLTWLAVAEVLEQIGQPLEGVWPYDPYGPVGAMPGDVGPVAHCRSEVRRVDSGNARAALEDGFPVVLGVRITPDWHARLEPPYVIPMREQGGLGHAVVAVGLGTDDTGELFVLIQNTWGPRWGSNGTAWLPWEYVRKHFLGYLKVEECLVD